MNTLPHAYEQRNSRSILTYRIFQLEFLLNMKIFRLKMKISQQKDYHCFPLGLLWNRNDLLALQQDNAVQ